MKQTVYGVIVCCVAMMLLSCKQDLAKLVGTKYSGNPIIVYHRHPLGDNAGSHRLVCIENMTFEKDGHIRKVQLTNTGVKARKLK